MCVTLAFLYIRNVDTKKAEALDVEAHELIDYA
jgi:hypothetical protein